MKTFNDLFNSIVNEKIIGEPDGNLIVPPHLQQQPQRKFLFIDLYEQNASFIKEQDFNEYKRGCSGRKKKGVIVYSCEEYMVLAIDC